MKVVAVEAPATARRVGFLEGAIKVPKDFDQMGAAEIAQLFGVEP